MNTTSLQQKIAYRRVWLYQSHCDKRLISILAFLLKQIPVNPIQFHLAISLYKTTLVYVYYPGHGVLHSHDSRCFECILYSIPTGDAKTVLSQ